MMKLRALGQTPAPQQPTDWRGVWAGLAFVAGAYFFIAAPETPEWLKKG
jgi:hypothetical protein